MKKRFNIKYLFICFLILQCFLASSQNQRLVDSIQKFIQSTTNDTSKTLALISLSDQYKNNNLDKALKYGQDALDLSIKANISQRMGYSHNKIGDLYLEKGDLGSALDHYLKALKISENRKDSTAICRLYHSIGEIYYQKKNPKEALNYFNISLSIAKQLNLKKEMSMNYNSIGIIYTIQKKYNEALKNYRYNQKISEELGNEQGIAACCANISIVYYQMGDLSLAIEYTKKAIKIHEEIGNKGNLLGNYSNLGVLYIQVEKYNEAEAVLQKAMDYVKESSDKNVISTVYENFAELYERKNDFYSAYKYSELFADIKDTIYSESNSRQSNELTAKYESEKKELTISSLEKDNALADEKLTREKNLKIYLLLFSILIAAVGFVLFNGNIQKKKANLALSSAYKEIEEKNKDITDSINYSKRIQDASLPPIELNHQLFPDSFILFKPKDIVSGDFYWYAEKNGKKLIAACDCTGHGVPGALMSMLGINFLNQIVNENGITSPTEILNLLHKEIRTALKQEEQNESKDGMDIALVTFNSETEIEYAGAHRPLWIIDDKKKESIEIKPDKFSIGGLQSETERKFTNHKIGLSKGDSIYIFSDGYADQFGGVGGKKFMTKNFKSLLLNTHSKPMVEQKHILKQAMKEWKGERYQVDDVLVIGIRI